MHPRNILQRGLDGRAGELAVADAEQGECQKVGGVVRLGCRHRHRHGHFEFACIGADEGGAAFIARFGDEGLCHQSTFCGILGPFDKEREGQRPGAHLWNVPLQLPPTLRDGGVLRPHGVAEDGVGTSSPGRTEFGAEVFHTQRKPGHVHRLQALAVQGRFDVLEPGLAIACRVGKDGHLGPATFDQVVHHKRGLDGIACGRAEDIAFAGRVAGGDRGAGCAGDDQRGLRRLVQLQRLHGVAGVAKADGGHHTLVHELLRARKGFVGFALVVLDHQFKGPAQEAAHRVDFFDGQLHAVQHRCSEIGRGAGKRADDADAYRCRCGLGLGGAGDAGHEAGQCPDESWCFVERHGGGSGLTVQGSLVSSPWGSIDVFPSPSGDCVGGRMGSGQAVSDALTAAETKAMSALPARRDFTAPMTLPMSPGPVAPSSVTMAFTSAAISSADRRAGR